MNPLTLLALQNEFINARMFFRKHSKNSDQYVSNVIEYFERNGVDTAKVPEYSTPQRSYKAFEAKFPNWDSMNTFYEIAKDQKKSEIFP